MDKGMFFCHESTHTKVDKDIGKMFGCRGVRTIIEGDTTCNIRRFMLDRFVRITIDNAYVKDRTDGKRVWTVVIEIEITREIAPDYLYMNTHKHNKWLFCNN